MKFFSWLDGVVCLENKTTEVKCHFNYNLSQGHAINIWIIIVDVDFDQPSEAKFAISLACPSCPFKEVMCSPHLKLEKLWWWSIYVNYLTFFCMEGLLCLFFLPLIHLFNLCLYHYWPTNVYFSLWVMIQYDFVYFVAKYFPALNRRNLCSWPLCPFEIVTPLYLVS